MYDAIILIIYGALVEAGGVMGYVKAKSKASLISGAVSGLLLIVCAIAILAGFPAGAQAGLGVTVLLCVVFAMRLAKTRKMMPSGMLLILSLAVAGLLLLA